MIQGSITSDWVGGRNWYGDDSLTVEVHQFDGGTLLHSESIEVGPEGNLWQSAPVDLVPGMHIVATGDQSGTVKAVTLVDLTFDTLDVDTDTVAGTAPEGQQIAVFVGDDEAHHTPALDR